MLEVTYNELKELRDSGKLVAGTQYSIIDYVTTTIQANTLSSNHQFDLIATADDGKGVIYRMIDEFSNDVPYNQRY